MSIRDLRPRMAYVSMSITVLLPSIWSAAAAQTFKQIENPARFTRSDAGLVIGLSGGGRTYKNFGGGGKVHRFVADRAWHRILIHREGEWFRAFNNDGSMGGRLVAPSDVDISAAGLVYIADRGNGRILVSQFNGENLIPAVGTFYYPGMIPSAVAWDGGANPFGTENVYVVDAAQGRVSYWTALGGTWSMQWSYGSPGSGTGQFRQPSGICVGHTASSPSGSSTFTPDFYVVDAGNKRLVRLTRSTSNPPGAPTWRVVETIADGWEPASCSVDHFGVVYVADRGKNRIVSYTWNLEEITRYGAFGIGASNLNTFYRPHAIGVPFARSASGTSWIGDGRVLTAEALGSGSGGLSHWLGVEIPWASATGTAWGPQLSYRTTGTSYHTIQVYSGSHQGGEQQTTTITTGQGWLRTPALLTQVWDGYMSNGQYAPFGLYHFHVSATSAYGCPGSEPWCQTSKWTTPVSWEGPPGGCECEWPEFCVPCEHNVALLLGGDPSIETGIPSEYRLGQILSSYAGPLLRVEGFSAGPAGRSMSGTDAVATVRAQGIRSLAVDVPRGGGRSRVTVRLYSLTGRLVRVLVDGDPEPGSYVVGWDGRDDGGRQVQPGVYVAVMTAGTYRGVQRLLLK